MKIHLSGLLQDMSGSLGNLVASSWKGLHYFREKASIVMNPKTINQAFMRTGLVLYLGLWKTLTPIQKALWEEYAQAQGKANEDESQEGSKGIIPPKSIIQSGVNAFIGVNQLWRSTRAPAPAVLVPPVGAWYPPNSPTAVFDNVLNQMTITFDSGPISTVTERFRLWQKGMWKASHGYIEKSDEVVPGVNTFILNSIRMGSNGYVEQVPYADVLGRTVAFQLDRIEQDGKRSPSTQILYVDLV